MQSLARTPEKTLADCDEQATMAESQQCFMEGADIRSESLQLYLDLNHLTYLVIG